MKYAVPCICILFFVSSLSQAQDNWQFSLSAGSAHANDIDHQNGAIQFDSDTVYQFVANHYDNANEEGAHLYYEVLLSAHSLQTENQVHEGLDIRSYHLQFGGAYEWSDWKIIRPYLSATLGTSYYDSDAESGEPYFSGTLGIGGRYHFAPGLSIKLEARAIGTVLDGDVDVFCEEETCSPGISGDLWWQQHITAGFSWSF